MKKKLLTLSIMVCALSANAQTYTDHLQTREAGKGNVTIHESREIDELVNGTKPNASSSRKQDSGIHKKQEQNNVLATNSSKGSEEKKNEEASTTTAKRTLHKGEKIETYRLQVFAGSNSREDKEKAYNTGNRIKAKFPGQQVYVHFYSPRWICRMGNFRTKEEAQEMLKQVKAAGFPQASIIKGKVTVKK